MSEETLEQKASYDYKARTNWELQKKALPQLSENDIYRIVLFTRDGRPEAYQALVGYCYPQLTAHVSVFLSTRPEILADRESTKQVLDEAYLAVMDAIENFNITEAQEKNVTFIQYFEACVASRMTCLELNSQNKTFK